MSNSGLVSYTKISSMKSSGRSGQKIVGVAIHTMAGNLTVEGCGNVFQSAEASSNYGIGSDGRIGLYVNESDRSWCTSSAGVDNRAVTIEVASTTATEPFACSDAAYKSLLNLCVDICVRNNIDSLKWQANASLGTSFNVAQQNMWAHRWFASKSCPGNYLYEKMGAIASAVNNKLKTMSSAERSKILSGAKYTPSGVDSSGAYDNVVGGLVDAPAPRAYVVTVNHLSPNFDYKKFKEKNIIGVCVMAGRLFSDDHRRYTSFQNPKLDSQIKAIGDAGLPFGFYFHACARTSAEIRDEIYELSFVTRKYPCKLGLWLWTHFDGNSKATNDKLLNEYYERLLFLGFARQLGICMTPNNLKNQITWDIHKEKWWYWMFSHFKDTSQFDQDPKYEWFQV